MKRKRDAGQRRPRADGWDWLVITGWYNEPMGRCDRAVVRLWPDEKKSWQQAAKKLEYPNLSRLIRYAVERLIEFESLPQPIQDAVERMIELESMPDYVVPDG